MRIWFKFRKVRHVFELLRFRDDKYETYIEAFGFRISHDDCGYVFALVIMDVKIISYEYWYANN